MDLHVVEVHFNQVVRSMYPMYMELAQYTLRASNKIAKETKTEEQFLVKLADTVNPAFGSDFEFSVVEKWGNDIPIEYADYGIVRITPKTPSVLH